MNTMGKTIVVVSGAVLALAVLCQWLVFRGPPDPTDPLVSSIGRRFQEHFAGRIVKRGVLNWDQDTFVWNRFGEKFGSNPNTPYMYSLLPLGGLLPSPMWRLRPHDAVVLIFKRPPPVEYFSATTFCLASRKRGFVFASLGDSLNSYNSKEDFLAHVVVTESSAMTLQQIKDALVDSGVALDAIHVAVVPNTLAEEDSLAFYEVVLRLFRFHNQTQGDEYLRSKQPVYYVKGNRPTHSVPSLPRPTYKERSHPNVINEPALLQNDFQTYQDDLVVTLHQIYQPSTIETIDFNPLDIRGLNCIDNVGHQCLGDCPDAAYFGSNIHNSSDNIKSLILSKDNEFHLATLVDHKRSNMSIYSNIALLTTHKPILNKTILNVRGTSIGVISNHEYQDHSNNTSPFFSWIFTRNPSHCKNIQQLNSIQGCTVMDEKEVPRDAYFAYCERLYLNPITGTGPEWNTILPASVHHFQNVTARTTPSKEYQKENAQLFARLQLPASDAKMPDFQGENTPLKFLHIIKTGGESLEGYLAASSNDLSMDYQPCRQASISNLSSAATNTSASCWASVTAISSLLCGLNCECCAADLYGAGGFHGTLLRSPRAHTLSLFSHGHNAHHTTWKRAASDVTLYLAEKALIGAEHLCGHSGTGGDSDWKQALQHNLNASLSLWPPGSESSGNSSVQVISLRNTQSHSLTCSKQTKGSLGQHFRVLPSVDSLEPDLEEALAMLHKMEWIGITDLYHPSLCLLHFQANQQSFPTQDCDCRNPHHHTNDPIAKPLGHWIEYRTKRGRSIHGLPTHVLEMMDAHTIIDAQLFAAALRLVLARLRRVEELTGIFILECIDWLKLKQNTDYIPGLWTGGPDSLLRPDL
ncbi:hypothetical protein ACHAWF_008682 [Thalassiosira exigua]